MDGEHDFPTTAAERYSRKQNHCGHPVAGSPTRLTYGYLAGALVRRHRPVGCHHLRDFARPHGLDLYLGTPPEVDSASHVWCVARYRISTFLRDAEREIVTACTGVAGSDEVINSTYRRAGWRPEAVWVRRAMATF